MKITPNTRYYRMLITIHCGGISISYPGYNGHFSLDEELKVPEFYLTEDQYFKRYDRCIEEHMRAALREYIEKYVLGRETAEVDADGNVIEETWELIPGHIEAKDFHMWTLPYYTKNKPESYWADENCKLHREEDQAYA